MKPIFQNTCLVLTIVLLAIIAFRPLERKVAAAGPVTQYKVTGVAQDVTEQQLEQTLRANARDGFTLDHTIEVNKGNLLVFKKEWRTRAYYACAWVWRTVLIVRVNLASGTSVERRTASNSGRN